MGLFFEFLEGRVFFELFDVVGQVGFFLFDFFFFHGSGSVRRRGQMLGSYDQLIAGFVGSLLSSSVPSCFAAEDRRHIHLVQAFLFAVPGAR